MACKHLDIRRHKTSETSSAERSEGNEFLRVIATGCDSDINIDVFQKDGKTCVGVSSKDMKREKEACVL